MSVELPPAETETVEPASSKLTWQTQAYIVGGLIGLLLGLISAYLYVRSSEETNREDKPGRVRTGDAMKLTLAVLTLIRQISELGTR